MDRSEALEKLRRLKGQDLRRLADDHNITVWNTNGKMNKGWAGHAVERYLGLPLNSLRNPNLGEWELKVVPLKRDRNNSYTVKETVSITMIDPVEVSQKTFEDSHLFTKLRKIIAVSRTREDNLESSSICKDVHAFELEGTELYAKVVEDYELIRRTIREKGFDALTGHMGQYVQPRTKGSGHGSTSRAFYARKSLVEYMLGWRTSPLIAPRTRVSPDCAEHSGKSNNHNRRLLDGIMLNLPANQSGAGRHKCAYCAYLEGYKDGLAEIGKSAD